MTEERYTVRGTKEESKLLRWLLNQASSDSARPVLTGLHIGKEYTVAADGFRMVQAPTPDCLQELADLTLTEGIAAWGVDKIPAGDFIADFEPIPGTYPDVTNLPPTHDVEARVTLNLKFLADLSKYGTKGHATFLLRGHNSAVEVLFSDLGDSIDKRYALIMPMADGRSAATIDEWPRPQLAQDQTRIHHIDAAQIEAIAEAVDRAHAEALAEIEAMAEITDGLCARCAEAEGVQPWNDLLLCDACHEIAVEREMADSSIQIDKTCEHAEHEDCLICAICGDCREDLNDDDVCPDCITEGIDEALTPSSGKLSPDRVKTPQVKPDYKASVYLGAGRVAQ